MNVVQASLFKKAVKKLHSRQKADLDKAIKTVMENPDIGHPKRGDIRGVLVYKFSMVKQHALLAYAYNPQATNLTLLAFGMHENFYRDLKKIV